MSAICDDLRKSILKAAMNGDLSASREEWTECELEKICSEITTGGAAPQGKNNFCDDGPCFVRVVDMGKLGVNKMLRDTRDHLSESGIGKLKLFPAGTILFTKSGASLLLNQRAILEKPMYVVSHIGCAIPNDMVIPDFLYLILKSIDFNDYAHATSLPSLKITDLKKVTVKYPSIEQQRLIVEKVDELMARVADLEKSADALASLKKVFPSDIKAALLQAAMQGKLTKQLPEDGSADKLLEQIETEKEELVAVGKAKKQKALAPIADDEIPFSIPENWRWVRLGELGMSRIGLTYSPKDISNDGVAVLRSNNIKNGLISYDNLVKVKCHVPQEKMCDKNDILICARNGSKRLVGKAALVDRNDVSFGAFMSIFRSKYNKYVLYYINSNVFRDMVLGDANTTTINQITQSMLNSAIIPLPPLAEQERIVERLNTLMRNVDAVSSLIASE